MDYLYTKPFLYSQDNEAGDDYDDVGDEDESLGDEEDMIEEDGEEEI